MPTLVIEFLGKRKRVRVERNASIGRTRGNDVRIDHPAISRTHAYIDLRDNRFYFEDIGSENGTTIDGHPLNGRRELSDGARIVIGPATITFHSDDAVIDVAQPEQFTDTLDGLLLTCSCGARLWVPDDRIGGTGRCPECGATLALGEKLVCSICQWDIAPDAIRRKCPDCGLTFHDECWSANLGCSAYGCPQVNSLADPRDQHVHEEEVGAPPKLEQPRRQGVRWERPLLAASIAASLLGILAFGTPAALVGVIGIAYLLRHKQAANVPMLAGCIIIATAGLVAGIAISGYWWLGWTLAQ